MVLGIASGITVLVAVGILVGFRVRDLVDRHSRKIPIGLLRQRRRLDLAAFKHGVRHDAARLRKELSHEFHAIDHERRIGRE